MEDLRGHHFLAMLEAQRTKARKVSKDASADVEAAIVRATEERGRKNTRRSGARRFGLPGEGDSF